MAWMKLAGLNAAERNTFHLHLFYQVIEGIILGVLALNEFVFLKSLQGTDYQVGVLFQFSVVVFIFLIFFNEFRKRIRNKRLLIRLSGILTRLPLAALVFFPATSTAYLASSVYHYIFLLIFLVYYFGNIIIYPAINVLLKTNYRHENFGRLYGYTTSVNKVVMLVVTFLYGILLDIDPFAFRYVFVITALLGVGSLYILSRIDYAKVAQMPGVLSLKESVALSVREMIGVVRENKPYRDFEWGFMFYGFAFMITAPVINILFEQELRLNYSSVAFYKNAYNIIAIVLLLFTGRILGRMDPRRFATLTFTSLLVYLFFLMLTPYFPVYAVAAGIAIYPTLIVAFISNGFFAGTMVLLWNIGSAYFCTPEEADDYQSVHLFLTGARSIGAPILGVVLYGWIGFTGAFLVAIGFLAVAIMIMENSYLRFRSLGRGMEPGWPY